MAPDLSKLVTPPPTSDPTGVCEPHDNTDCDDGTQLAIVGEVTSATDCCAACEKNKDCDAWTWNRDTDCDNHYCYLKQNCTLKTKDFAVVSGYKSKQREVIL